MTTMGETITKVAIFIAGAAVGSVVTWKLVKDKYEQMANDDIEAVRAYYRSKSTNEPESECEDDDNLSDPEFDEQDKDKYHDTLTNEGYVNYSDIRSAKTKKEDVKEDDDVGKPYVISPEEFGENDDYDTISLTYYADGVLADDQDKVIDDVDEVVGKDSLEHFGDYEEDAVHVRNDKLKTDFEILRDLDDYYTGE